MAKTGNQVKKIKLADRLTVDLLRFLYKSGHEYVLANHYINEYECDVFSITRSGFTCEFEIKISVSDYKADNKKCKYAYAWRNENKRVISKKHDLIKCGKRTNRFYYVVPKDLIKPEDIPDYAGLYYANFRENTGTYGFIKIKEAKLLKKESFPLNQYKNLCRSMFYKYITYYFKLREKTNI